MLGLGSSGKTCVLAALALPSVTRAQGLAATGKNAATGDNSSTEARSLLVGAAGFQKAVARIKDSRLPSRTAPEEVQGRLRFVLSVTNGGSPATMEIETFDYPGALLTTSPREQHTSEVLAARLDEADALLVLVEAGSPDTATARRLVGTHPKLVELISRHVGDKPVAVLLTKWDQTQNRRDSSPRLPGMQQPPASDPSELARRWLATSDGASHAALVEAIEQKVGRENVQVFAASALGEVVLRADIYRRGGESVYRIWTIAPGRSGEGVPDSSQPSLLVYESDGRHFHVTTFDEPARSIEYRDASGVARSAVFEESDLSGSFERRINWRVGVDAPRLGSFGIEDAA
jgi:hypothetical protein